MQLNPYLMFNGNCREAFEFYAKALGAKIATISTYGDMPGERGGITGADLARIMHVRLEHPDFVLMGSDTHPAMGYAGIAGVSLSIQCGSAAELDGLFAALQDGGKVSMAPDRTFWSERFCMFEDRYGVDWMLNFEGDAKRG
jgi:PhnB protein